MPRYENIYGPVTIAHLHQAVTECQEKHPNRGCANPVLKIFTCPDEDCDCSICALSTSHRPYVLREIKKLSIRNLK
jgi:hypothetical protein